MDNITNDTKKVTLNPSTYQKKIEWSSGNPIYVGTAAPGLPTSTQGWCIQKLTYSGNDVVAVQTCESGTWDNRTSEKYA